MRIRHLQMIARWPGGIRLAPKFRRYIRVKVRTKYRPPGSHGVCRFEIPHRYALIVRRWRAPAATHSLARTVKSGTHSEELKAGTSGEAGTGVSSSFGLEPTTEMEVGEVLTKGTSVGRYLVLERIGA